MIPLKLYQLEKKEQLNFVLNNFGINMTLNFNRDLNEFDSNIF